MADDTVSIVPLDEHSQPAYCHCLEEWSDEMKEAADIKCDWVAAVRDIGLGVRMARNEAGEYVGMIQYLPAELTAVDAPGHYHIHCCWVHAYRGKGVGDWRGRGIGKALLAAAEEDVRHRGADGITAWGLSIPVWMKASWYRKQGYLKAAADGMMTLMWKPFAEDAVRPAWRKPSPDLDSSLESGPVKILSLVGGICPSVNVTQERIRRLAAEYGDRIDYERVAVRSADDVARWGLTDGLYIDGRALGMGPPMSEKKLRGMLEKAIRKAAKRGRRTTPARPG